MRFVYVFIFWAICIAISIAVAKAQPTKKYIFSTQASKEIIDSVNREKPAIRVDSIAFYANVYKDNVVLSMHPQVVYDHRYTFTYKKFVLTITVPWSGDPPSLEARSGQTTVILHPDVAYAILEKIKLPSKTK